MRKIFTFACFIVLVFSANGQIQKGTTFVGGVLGFNATDYSGQVDNSSTSFGVTPSYGRFYRDNRLFGVSLFLSHAFRKNQPDDEGYGAGVFFRQYRAIGKSAFMLFFQESASYNYVKYYSFYHQEPLYSYEYKTNSIRVNLEPGVAYGISKRLQLEVLVPTLVSLNYLSIRNERNEGGPVAVEKNKSFNLSAGLPDGILGNLSVGIRWLIL